MIRLPAFTRLTALLLCLTMASAFAQEKDKDKKDDDPAKAKAAESAEKDKDKEKKDADDPAKLKATIESLQKKVAQLELKIATMKLEKLGARVTTDKPKDGPEVTTVNILKVWSGDKDTIAKFKELPNVQVVYIDNSQFND